MDTSNNLKIVEGNDFYLAIQVMDYAGGHTSNLVDLSSVADLKVCIYKGADKTPIATPAISLAHDNASVAVACIKNLKVGTYGVEISYTKDGLHQCARELYVFDIVWRDLEANIIADYIEWEPTNGVDIVMWLYGLVDGTKYGTIGVKALIPAHIDGWAYQPSKTVNISDSGIGYTTEVYKDNVALSAVDGMFSIDEIGDYRVVYTLTGYKWQDDTTEEKIDTFTITKASNVIIWDTDPSGVHTIGDSVAFVAHAQNENATVIFKDGDNNIITSPITVNSNMTIKAIAAATTHYSETVSPKSLTARAPSLPMYWGMSISNEYIPDEASPYSSGTTLKSELDDGGTFASGAVKDYGSTLIASIYFAVPSGKTVAIIGAAAGGNVTSDFTKTTVNGYDIYYLVGFIQEKFTINVN